VYSEAEACFGSKQGNSSMKTILFVMTCENI